MVNDVSASEFITSDRTGRVIDVFRDGFLPNLLAQPVKSLSPSPVHAFTHVTPGTHRIHFDLMDCAQMEELV